MNAPEKFVLPDTQALPDTRQLPIQKVGVKGLRYPLTLRIASGDAQHTVADFAMYVGLPHDVKGTHMSRFVETLEELARSADDEASCAAYGLLKRPDEKWGTERAYDNPKFVEDLVRDIAMRLQRDPRIGRFTVASENFESIHNHSAYAEIAGRGAALID
ncbi:MAG: GTP cyclohydrolase, FolE2/MptA family [Betaproteobacteria bacterium]